MTRTPTLVLTLSPSPNPSPSPNSLKAFRGVVDQDGLTGLLRGADTTVSPNLT